MSLTQSSHQVLIGLGSNLDDPVNQIKTAIKSLERHESIDLIKTSSLYQSLPQGPQDQDNFINAVILISTSLIPEDLLSLLKEIENKQGRVKKRHWGERCIDLDILFYNDLSYNSSRVDLKIPHIQATTRDFVVLPCLEICPEWQLPDQSYLKNYLEHCLNHQLQKIDDDLTCV